MGHCIEKLVTTGISTLVTRFGVSMLFEFTLFYLDSRVSRGVIDFTR